MKRLNPNRKTRLIVDPTSELMSGVESVSSHFSRDYDYSYYSSGYSEVSSLEGTSVSTDEDEDNNSASSSSSTVVTATVQIGISSDGRVLFAGRQENVEPNENLEPIPMKKDLHGNKDSNFHDSPCCCQSVPRCCCRHVIHQFPPVVQPPLHFIHQDQYCPPSNACLSAPPIVITGNKSDHGLCRAGIPDNSASNTPHQTVVHMTPMFAVTPDANLPVPIEKETKLTLSFPKIVPRYIKKEYEILVPRVVEVPYFVDDSDLDEAVPSSRTDFHDFKSNYRPYYSMINDQFVFPSVSDLSQICNKTEGFYQDWKTMLDSLDSNVGGHDKALHLDRYIEMTDAAAAVQETWNKGVGAITKEGVEQIEGRSRSQETL
eukprot:GHVH01007487.1.p2 GENE.GHVH01007487.1~~GHVH01007487.1.p2  ORF type:complete len:374 (-),score=42.03 GHVH01007487.1:77-1198(-)